MQKKPMRGKGQRLLVHILLSALALCAVLCGSFAAFSALLCRVDTPVNLVAPLATAGLCCAVLAAAFFLALLEQSRGLLLGLLVGAVCALALLIWAAGQGGEVTGALFLSRARHAGGRCARRLRGHCRRRTPAEKNFAEA